MHSQTHTLSHSHTFTRLQQLKELYELHQPLELSTIRFSFVVTDASSSNHGITSRVHVSNPANVATSTISLRMVPEAGIHQSREMRPDTELLAHARSGDHAAFRSLVERYEPVVAGTVQGMLGPGPEAEDVGQETFIRFYRALDSFREDSSLKTYLTRIAINLSLNALKRRRRLRDRFVRSDEHEFPEPALNGDGHIERAERDSVVRRAIDRLDPKHRAVVVLRMINGYSTKETAELLGLPLGTVLSRLSRGMKHLESLLKPYEYML